MTQSNAYSQYKESNINTSTPEELTLMLYNGLIKFIMQAQKAVDDKDMPKAHSSILRAQDIIQEFITTLDRKYEVAQSLLVMYDYMNHRLIEANTKKDRAILEEVLGFSKELRDTWSQAMRMAKQQARAQNVAAAK